MAVEFRGFGVSFSGVSVRLSFGKVSDSLGI